MRKEHTEGVFELEFTSGYSGVEGVSVLHIFSWELLACIVWEDQAQEQISSILSA